MRDALGTPGGTFGLYPGSLVRGGLLPRLQVKRACLVIETEPSLA